MVSPELADQLSLLPSTKRVTIWTVYKMNQLIVSKSDGRKKRKWDNRLQIAYFESWPQRKVYPVKVVIQTWNPSSIHYSSMFIVNSDH